MEVTHQEDIPKMGFLSVLVNYLPILGSGVMSGTAPDLEFFQKLNFKERGIN